MTNDLFRDVLAGKIPMPAPAPRRAAPRRLTMAEIQQGLGLQGIIVESWQLQALGKALATHLVRPFDNFSIEDFRTNRRKTPDRVHPFNWAASKQPSPPTSEAPALLHLNMWEDEHVKLEDPRQRALAAKAARGHGPPSPSGWRGRERNTKYRSK